MYHLWVALFCSFISAGFASSNLPSLLSSGSCLLKGVGVGAACQQNCLHKSQEVQFLMRFQIYSCPAPLNMVQPGYCLQGPSGYVCFSLVCIIKFCLLPLLLGAWFLVTGSL